MLLLKCKISFLSHRAIIINLCTMMNIFRGKKFLEKKKRSEKEGPHHKIDMRNESRLVTMRKLLNISWRWWSLSLWMSCWLQSPLDKALIDWYGNFSLFVWSPMERESRLWVSPSKSHFIFVKFRNRNSLRI